MTGRVVVVGGVDPTGAAGVAAIASTARMLGIYSALVPTAVVVEDSGGVRSVHPVGGRVLEDALGAALAENPGAVVALSMHPRVEEARASRRLLEGYTGLVLLDPVWAASVGRGGGLTLDDPRAVVRELLEAADILVVNVDELGVLAGRVLIRTPGGVAAAAKQVLKRHGLLAVVVKGGHGLECSDVIVEHDGYAAVGGSGCLPGGAHGTGCVYLGALAAGLALRLPLIDAARLAWDAARSAVEEALVAGGGARLAWPKGLTGYWERLVLSDVEAALRLLLENWPLVERHVPETGLNIVSVAPLGVDVWAGVAGRVRRSPLGPVHGPVALRASSHLYRALRALHSNGVTWLRGAVNIATSEDVLRAAERLGYVVAFYDRRLEPPEAKEREGATIPWGIRVALESVEPRVPDIIYHEGDWGKEPMTLVLGSTAREAVSKLLRILARI